MSKHPNLLSVRRARHDLPDHQTAAVRDRATRRAALHDTCIGIGVASLLIGLLASIVNAGEDACPPYEPVNARVQPMASFTEEAMQRGLVYLVQGWNPNVHSFFGHGVAIADLNGNGHNDVVVMGRQDGRVGFFENDARNPGHFIDRSCHGSRCGGAGQGTLHLQRGSGIAVADYNGNGLLDIYFTQESYWPNVLLRNNGDFEFTNVAVAAGVANEGYGQGAAWADFNNSGWLDLYVVNYTYAPDVSNPARRNKLYRNRGDETFLDVSVLHGVDDPGMGYAAVFTDINRNCRPDLHLVNERGHMPPAFFKNRLWRNHGGAFSDISAASGTSLGLWSMGVATGDLTGNGFPDFYITNLSYPLANAQCGLNPLLINQGGGPGFESFTEHCHDAGVCADATGWSTHFFDMNNNGRLDLYVVNQGQPNNLFANFSDKDGLDIFPLADMTSASGTGGSTGQAFSAATGDLTGDGALDLILNNFGFQGTSGVTVQLLINNEGATRNWIRFRIVGQPNTGNVHAIGASVEVTTNDRVQWREVYAGGNNFKSQNELVWHFGLDGAAQADHMTIRWPYCNLNRTLVNYPANHVWTIWPPQLLGDINDDGVINGLDLVQLLSAWGPLTAGYERLDMNGDGVINGHDLVLLLSKWGPLE